MLQLGCQIYFTNQNAFIQISAEDISDEKYSASKLNQNLSTDPNMVDKTEVKAGNGAEFEVQENGTTGL